MVGVVRKIKLGSQGLEVSAQGLGCMDMSAFYGPPKPDEDMIALIHHVVSTGVTFLDTSDIYGPCTNEILLGKALKGGVRDKVELAAKFGISFADNKREIRDNPAYVKAVIEGSLKCLGVGSVDLYYEHQVDTRVPIEVTKFAMNFMKAAEAIEAEREHLATVVNSVVNVWSAGDIMTLTAAAATRGASFCRHPQGRLHLSLLPTNPKHFSSFSRSLSVEQTDVLLKMALLKWKLASWMTKREVELLLSSPLLTDPAKDNMLLMSSSCQKRKVESRKKRKQSKKNREKAESKREAFLCKTTWEHCKSKE